MNISAQRSVISFQHSRKELKPLSRKHPPPLARQKAGWLWRTGECQVAEYRIQETEFENNKSNFLNLILSYFTL